MAVPKLPLRLTGTLYRYHLWWWQQTLRKRSALTEWNHRHHAIFVHIPKTAGTSILAALGAPEVFDTHAPARTYAAAYPGFCRTAFKFAIVRDPWDRFASSFHFMKSGTGWKMQQDWARAHIGDLSFAEFVHRLRRPLFRATVMAERFFWPQTFWLGGIGNAGGVDQLYRFEELDGAVQAICERLDIPVPAATPHLRRVAKPDYRLLYDEETAAIVGRLYRHDVAALSYASPK